MAENVMVNRAEGVSDRAEDVSDRAEGVYNRAEGVSDCAEGVSDCAEGVSDCAKGVSDRAGVSDCAEGVSDRAEGIANRTEGVSDHAEGVSDRAEDISDCAGVSDCAEGIANRTEGVSDRAEDISDCAGVSDCAEGIANRTEGVSNHAEGVSDHTEGVSDRAEGISDCVEGVFDRAGVSNCAEGVSDCAVGVSDPAEGISNRTEGVFDRAGVSNCAEGVSDRAEGVSDHAEGVSNRAEGVSEAISDSDYDPDFLKDVIKRNRMVESRFRKIIGGSPKIISERSVPERGSCPPTGGLGIFYRYFFSKYVSMWLKEDATSAMLDNHASIFPFQTKGADSVAVAEMPPLDDAFGAEIAQFVEQHFGGDCDADALKNLFWANVVDFRATYFAEPPSLEALARLVEVGSAGKTVEDRVPFLDCEYLRTFVRLKSIGTQWYLDFQTKFNEICVAYGREELKLAKSGSYFRFLPEINCCELLLLLETDYYARDARKYVRLFEKYLFFFKNARDRGEHAVCFVDDTLFECLRFKRAYETFEEGKSIYDCVWELWMMSLVHCRRFALDSQQAYARPDRVDLEKVVAYADQLLEGVQSACVYYGEARYPRFKLYLLLDDTVFLNNYSRRASVNFHDLCAQMMKSALLSPEIKKLKFYNAFLGEEIVYEMPQRKEEIREFIKRLIEKERAANRLEPEYPIKFLIPRYVRKYFSVLPAIPRY